MNVYKITFWKFFKPSIKILFLLFFFLCLMGILMILLFHRDGDIPFFLILSTIFWVLFLSVPNIILSINYYKADSKKRIFIDFNKEKITIFQNGKKKVLFFKNIDKIVKIGLSSSKYNGIITTAPWRHFYYYKIELQDQSFVCITRFLIQNFENVLPKLPCEYVQQTFPLVKQI